MFQILWIAHGGVERGTVTDGTECCWHTLTCMCWWEIYEIHGNGIPRLPDTVSSVEYDRPATAIYRYSRNLTDVQRLLRPVGYRLEFSWVDQCSVRIRVVFTVARFHLIWIIRVALIHGSVALFVLSTIRNSWVHMGVCMRVCVCARACVYHCMRNNSKNNWNIVMPWMTRLSFREVWRDGFISELFIQIQCEFRKPQMTTFAQPTKLFLYPNHYV